MMTWRVTMRTGPDVWSTVTVEATNHDAAIDRARGLIGGVFSRIEEGTKR